LAVALLQVATACPAQTQEGARMQPGSAAKAGPAPVERLEYLTQGGRELAPGLHQVETSLRVDLATGEAVAARHQPSSDEGGQALGTSRATLAPAALVRLREALGRVDLGKKPPPGSGGIGASLLTIRHRVGGQVREVALWSRNPTAMAPFDPLLEALAGAMREVEGHPWQAVRLAVRHRPGPGRGAFEVVVKNVGNETVALPDLQALGRGAPAPERWLGVRVAFYPPEEEGVTQGPLEWEELGLAGGAGDGRPVVLEPGAEIAKVTAPWKPAKAGRHLVQAVFASYGAAPEVEKRPAIRGRALSEAVEVGAR
jgi:hypothetical protein